MQLVRLILHFFSALLLQDYLLILITVRQLALQYSKSTLSASGGSFLIYLTARSAERGTEAVKFLENDAQLRNSKVLVNEGGPTTIKCRELDIGKAESIHKLTGYVKSQYPEGIDIVINNAGIALTGFGESTHALWK